MPRLRFKSERARPEARPAGELSQQPHGERLSEDDLPRDSGPSRGPCGPRSLVLRVTFIYVVWLLGCLLFELKKKTLGKTERALAHGIYDQKCRNHVWSRLARACVCVGKVMSATSVACRGRGPPSLPRASQARAHPGVQGLSPLWARPAHSLLVLLLQRTPVSSQRASCGHAAGTRWPPALTRFPSGD